MVDHVDLLTAFMKSAKLMLFGLDILRKHTDALPAVAVSGEGAGVR